MSALAREQGFAVLYPAQGPGRQTRSGAGIGSSPTISCAAHGEAAVLAGMTRAVLAQHGLDARRVYVAGLSAGGAMAAILGQGLSGPLRRGWHSLGAGEWASRTI